MMFARAAVILTSLVWTTLGVAQPESPLALDALEVTGTHLGREAGMDPLVSFDRNTLRNSGHATLGEFLQALPMMSGSPLGTSVNQRGSGGAVSRGIESVELRGLGSRRTLILINGRRMLAGGNGAAGVVDLASIPVALVERVEVLTTSASVAYGADAIAGVVNVITRSDVDGVEVSARVSQTESGDGDVLDLSAVTGRRFGSTWLSGGVSLFDQAAVGRGDRDFSSQWLTVDGPANAIVPTGSSAPPNGRFRTSDGNVTLIDGEDGDSPDDFRPFINDGPDTDRFNFNPFEDLVQDSRRVSAFGSLRHDLSPSLSLFAEALFQQRDSDTQIAPLPFFTNRLDGVTVSADNIYNPFGEEISDARRRLVEGGPRRFAQDNQLWRVVIGADGLVADWQWETSLSYGRNEVEQRQSGDLRRDRVALALGPSFISGDGVATCGTEAAPVVGCVPLNLFGGPGSITDDMLAYAGIADLIDTQQNEETTFGFDLRRELLRLPAGPVPFAAGISLRDARAEDRPDTQTQAGNTTGAARQRTRGEFDSREVFAEVGIPLLAGRSGVHALGVELGLRAVDYSNFDAETVFDVSALYQPVQSVTLRAGYAEAFRAPTVGELFGGATEANPIVEDPCADFSQLGQPQVDRCIAQGVPSDGSFDQTGNETPTLGGGNPALAPEQAESFTAGVVYSPSGWPGLRVSLDYFDIRIEDGIAALGANTVLEQCLETGSAQFCDRIDRHPDGSITQIRTALQNTAEETARGLDLDVQYAHTTSWGRWQHRLLISRVLEREVRSFPGAQPFVGEGQYDPDLFGVIPEWKGRYALAWSQDRWLAGYGLEWIDALTDSGGEVAPGTDYRIGSRLYHDLHAGLTTPQNLRVTLGIANATDREPPFIPNGGELNTDESAYRLLGRTYWLRLNLAL